MSSLALQLIDEAYNNNATFLDLGNCGLKEIPVEILKLKDSLQHLNLGSRYYINDDEVMSTNYLAENSLLSNEVSLNTLGSLNKLSSLSLSGLDISDIGANYLSTLSALMSLNLFGNRITAKGVLSISNMSSLTSLTLAHNNIEDTGAAYISKLSSLARLNVSGTRITSKGAKYISRLSSLTSLSLGHNAIGSKGAIYISKLTALTYLNVYKSEVGEAGARHISRLSSLTTLDIGHNGIGENGAESISRLTSLKSLNIAFNDIREKGAIAISQLFRLTSLNIDSNSIKEKGAELISRLTNLTTLNIGKNNIGPVGAASISKLSSLTSLDIYYNNLGIKGAQYIGSLAGLTTLDVAGNEFEDEGLAYISQLSSLTYLNLGRNQITQIGAEYIARLPSLTYLNLNENNIGSKGAEYISRIPLLTWLSLDKNNIDELGAEHIARLPSLTYLNLNENNIGSKGAEYISRIPLLTWLSLDKSNIDELGAEHIGKLSALTYLGMENNMIGEKGVEAICKLSSLRKLNLSKNGIEGNWLKNIHKLSALTELNLIGNKIDRISFDFPQSLNTLRLQHNELENIPLSLVNNLDLKIDTDEDRDYRTGKIFIKGNPIKTPPPEVVNKGRDAIREYWESSLRSLNECKLIFVGDGSVGKTSLMKRLVFREFKKNETTTHGINKIAWTGISNEQGEPIKLNLWDFGGQHIQHSLHQFFFTERVVYVLVLNPRNDEKAGYWLDQVDKLGPHSQLIIVYNWKDKEDKQADFLRNFRELRKTYKYLPEPIVLSCATGEGMKEFEAAVKTAVLANEGLKTMYPEKWFIIKKKLEARIPIEKHYIKYQEYEQWCEEEKYDDPDRRRNLLRILDSVGAIVFFDKPVLNELQVLNPEWISTGAYAIITDEITRQKKGHLAWSDLRAIFSQEKVIFSDKSIRIKYEEPQFNFILQLMLDYRLCQKNPLVEHEYLIPSAFGEKPEKQYDIDGGRHYRLKFQSPFEMLIIHRFIAKNVLNIVSNDYWNSGIYFKHAASNTYALVETNQYSQVIDCWIKGENVRGMWEVIRNDFREIFNMYHNFPVDEEIEYQSDQQTVFLKYDDMIRAMHNGVVVIPYDPQTGLKNINVLNILELFEPLDHNKLIKMAEQIKIEVNPSITISPQINPIMNSVNTNNTTAEPEKKPAKTATHVPATEDLLVRKWKNKALTILLFSTIATTVLVMVWMNKWWFTTEKWGLLEKYDAIKWAGVILGLGWNGLIIKMFYDRFLDPSKEKAYRDSLRK